MGNFIIMVHEGWDIYWIMAKEMWKFLLHDARGQAFWATSIIGSMTFSSIIAFVGIKYMTRTRKA